MALQRVNTISQYKVEARKLMMILSRTEARAQNADGIIRQLGAAISSKDVKKIESVMDKLRKEAQYYGIRDSSNSAQDRTQVYQARLQEHLLENRVSQGNGRLVY